MRLPLLRIIGLALALALPAVAGVGTVERGPLQRAALAAPQDPNHARVIVKYRASSALMRAQSAGAAIEPQHAAALGQRLALPLVDGRVLGSRTQALRGAGLNSSQLAARLAAQPDVEWAVVDGRKRIVAVPNDPYFGDGQTAITPAAGQWYLRVPDATIVAAINAVGAWDLTTGSALITVAVIDTGVRFDHPDLAGKLWPGYDFIADLATANDGNGRDGDASDPGDWVAANECAVGEAADNSSWHGTQVAGLIGAATNNALGIAGVGYKTMVLPVRVLGKCGGFDSDILAGMRWAAGLSNNPAANPHPARVLNLSLGSAGSCSASYRDAIGELVNAGVTVVVAAGNDSGNPVGEPANCPGALAVAGVRHTGTKVGFSSIGAEVAISAPAGNCVNPSGTCLYPLLTTANAGVTAPSINTYSDGSNATLGTSFSTPLVAGTAALLLAIDSTLTPARVRSALQAGARPFPASGAASDVLACRAPDASDQFECYCTAFTCGAGLLDAARAASVVASLVPPPTVSIAASAAPQAGSSITLSAANASAGGGRAITGYQWTITAGGTLATLTGATNASAVTLAATGAGNVTVMLTVTDSAGSTGSASSTLTISAAPTPGSGSGGSKGGGGALGWGWMLGLIVAIAALGCGRR